MAQIRNDIAASGFSFTTMLAGFALALLAAFLVLAVPAWQLASAPNDATGAMVVSFPPHTSEYNAMAAIHQAGGLPVKQTQWGNFWIVQVPRPGFVHAVKERGAWAVLQNLPGSISLAGCTGIVTIAKR